MGAGYTHEEPVFTRRAEVSRAARARRERFDEAAWEAAMVEFADLDLTRTFAAFDQRFDELPSPEELQAILERMGKSTPEDLLDCGACGYDGCREHAVAIWQGLAEVEMCMPYAIERLRESIDELEETNRSLESTKEALVKSEKLASMGQLAAGIAHEVNNPLGILLLHANLLLEECDNDPWWQPTRSSSSTRPTAARRSSPACSTSPARAASCASLPTSASWSRDVLRTFPREEDVEIVVDDQLGDPVAEIDADQIVQVLINLLANAQHAMPDGGRITITLDGTDDNVILMVADAGTGIAPEHLEKLFSPFFTTKQVGKGTGLGLAVTHGIVKMHRGQIAVESNADPAKGPTFTTFTISLPRHELEAGAALGLQESTVA